MEDDPPRYAWTMQPGELVKLRTLTWRPLADSPGIIEPKNGKFHQREIALVIGSTFIDNSSVRWFRIIAFAHVLFVVDTI